MSNNSKKKKKRQASASGAKKVQSPGAKPELKKDSEAAEALTTAPAEKKAEKTASAEEKTEKSAPAEKKAGKTASAATAKVAGKDETSGKKTGKTAASGEKTLRTMSREPVVSGTKLYLLLSFVVPMIIMFYAFKTLNIYAFAPDGDKQVLYSDCKQQYLPFLKEFQRKLKDGESMYYTWHNGMGTNFMAMIGYYIASPLNLLTVFIPAKYIREALAVFMIIKISCASLFTALFLKHVYRRNDISITAFGCCYAFCDYIMGYYWNTIWLDSVALLPLVALGVYCVVKEGKYKLYVISLALAFMASYYIGYMICVFVLLWFIVQTIVQRVDLEKFLKDVLKMAGYSLIAVCMTLPVTLPALVQLKNTVGTDDKFPEKLELYHNFAEMISAMMSFDKPTNMEGLPNIGAGIFCILMLVVYVRSKHINRGEKIAMLSLLGFLFISLNVKSLDYIWHGFHYPNLIPSRFAFLFCFVFVVIAYRAFTVLTALDKNDIIGMCIITVVMFCISVFYLTDEDEKKAVIGSLIVAGMYIMFMLIYERDLINRRMLTMATSIAIIAEMTFCAYFGTHNVGATNRTDYPAKEAEVTELVDYANETSGGDLFRTDQVEYSVKNDGMIYGYNSAGQFSSTSYKNIIDFCADFGLISKRSSFQYMVTSPVVNMFLNEKYIISRSGFYGAESSLTEVRKASDNVAAIYENKYYLPIAYIADKAIEAPDMENETVFETQNKVFRAATGIDKDVYTMMDPMSFDCLNMTHQRKADGMFSYSLNSGEGNGEIKVTYRAPKDGMMYAWANVRSSSTVSVKSEKVDHTYNVDGQRYVFPLGYFKQGHVVTISADADKNKTNEIAVAFLNSDVLDEGYAKLADETLNVTSFDSASVKGEIDVKSDGVLMTSIPYENGWTLRVDGEKTELKPALSKEIKDEKTGEVTGKTGVFLCADIAPGKHTIEFTYVPEGFYLGLIAGGLALAAFIGLCVYDFVKTRRKKEE